MVWTDILAIVRDVAVILLALEALLLGAVPLFIFFQAQKGLRNLRPKAHTTLHQVRLQVTRAAHDVDGALVSGRKPFIWFASMSEGMRAGVRRLQGR